MLITKKNNPTVGSLKNTLDQAEDGSVALPVHIVQTGEEGSVNKNPTIGRIEQALSLAEDGSMALPVEVVELTPDGKTFIRSTGGGGADGKSAYEIALEQGFEGDVNEWLESLKGERGDQGLTGAQGPPGEPGPQGVPGIQGTPGKDAEPQFTEEQVAALLALLDNE